MMAIKSGTAIMLSIFMINHFGKYLLISGKLKRWICRSILMSILSSMMRLCSKNSGERKKLKSKKGYKMWLKIIVFR